MYMARKIPNIITSREVEIKTSKSNHVPPSKMAAVSKTEDTKSWQRWREIVTLVHAGRDVGWISYFGKPWGSSSKR